MGIIAKLLAEAKLCGGGPRVQWLKRKEGRQSMTNASHLPQQHYL
jgi:hypothetical protein